MIQTTKIVYIGEPRVGFHNTDGTLDIKIDKIGREGR